MPLRTRFISTRCSSTRSALVSESPESSLVRIAMEFRSALSCSRIIISRMMSFTSSRSGSNVVACRYCSRWSSNIQLVIAGDVFRLERLDLRLHFDLGTERFADIEARRPLGEVEKLKQVTANRLVTVLRPSDFVQTGAPVVGEPSRRRGCYP
jgi:hypothetical protein